MSDQASTIKNNVAALKKASPGAASGGDTPSNAWIAIVAGVALLIFLN